jgi:hypothetical protein
MWVFFSDNLGMGMGIGIIATSLITKAVFAPFIMYSVNNVNINYYSKD